MVQPDPSGVARGLRGRYTIGGMASTDAPVGGARGGPTLEVTAATEIAPAADAADVAARGREEPKTQGGGPVRRAARLALSGLEFPGCDAFPMSLAEYRRFDGRLELWDAETCAAWMVREAPTWEHEGPAQTLSEMAALVAAVRGAPIKCYGAMGLVRRYEAGRRRRILHPDQSVYLHPWMAEGEAEDRVLVVGRSYPDVVLEVDHTTDVRAGKLKLYESWGLPELWVEVPELVPRSRPPGLVPGLTIHLLKEGRYRESTESRAFPGWGASEIHEALNEPLPSGRTHAMVERMGRLLGARGRTGPDDHLLMRSMRAESEAKGRAEGLARGREEGLAEGRAEGLTEGEARGRAKMAREVLRSRGIEVSAGFPADVPGFGEAPEDAVTAAALACRSEEDFRARLALGN